MMMATLSNNERCRQLIQEKLGKLFESKINECETKFKSDIDRLESIKYNFYEKLT